MDSDLLIDTLKHVQEPVIITQMVYDRPFSTPVKDQKDPAAQPMVQVPLMALPEGYRMENLKPLLDQFRDKPERREGTTAIYTSDSFIDFVKRYGGTDTALYSRCTMEPKPSASITAVFNDDPAGPDQRNAGWGDFKARYSFPVSEQFTAWVLKSGQAMDQKAFALFLHDRIPDLGDPAGAELAFDLGVLKPTYADPIRILELADGLEINAKKKYYQHERVNSGESALVFTEEHQDVNGQPLNVPQFFLLHIPVFEASEPIYLPVRLRYVVDGETQRIKWTYDVWNVKQIFLTAFQLEIAKIVAGTGQPHFFGEA